VSEALQIALLSLAGVALTALGIVLGSVITSRASRRSAEVTAAAAMETTTAQASDRLVDQLQEELGRYRDDNDRRVEKLEGKVDQLTEENRGYRAFIGVQRDHMAEHGIPLPPWPEHLPR